MDGETFTSVVNRGAICNELPRDFIYVDGRENANGMVVDSKMDYVPYLDGKNKVLFSAAKSVLNEYNTEVYIAVAPEANWGGCLYTENFDDPLEFCQMLTNFDAFAAFNKADDACSHVVCMGYMGGDYFRFCTMDKEMVPKPSAVYRAFAR